MTDLRNLAPRAVGRLSIASTRCLIQSHRPWLSALFAPSWVCQLAKQVRVFPPTSVRRRVGVGPGWAEATGQAGGWVVRHVRGAQADSAFDSSRQWTGGYPGGQRKTVAHGFEYGHGPPKTVTDDCPADGIQKVRGSNPPRVHH